MSRWLLWMTTLATACGDNAYPAAPLIVAATDLTIVAHQDDDLLFMQPDLYDAVQRGTGVTNVYITAGNGNAGHGHAGVDNTEKRDDALIAAYGEIAGSNDWSCGWVTIGANDVKHCRLDEAKLSLIFLGYPDGGLRGEKRDSLLHLWEGSISTASTVAFRGAVYDRATLIRTVSEIIGDTQPSTVRTLEVAATHGDDHSDHMIVGALAVLAIADSSVDPELISYRGYNIAGEPESTAPALYARGLRAFGHYQACAVGCARCGEACPPESIPPRYRDYLHRRSAIGMRRSAAGKLRIDDRCMTADADLATSFVDCAMAPTWRLDRHGTLSSDTGLCLKVFGDELIAGPASEESEDSDVGPCARFFYDDDGHLWSGAPPLAQPGMEFAHLQCVVSDLGRPRLALCGKDRAPRWEIARTMTSTPRNATTLTRTGRAVRMARLPGGESPVLCAREPGSRGVMCAAGTRSGGLLAARRLDSASQPLAIVPESLALGDVDRDGLADACGRDASGLVCATAADSYRARRWSAWPQSSDSSASDASLAITAHGQICGLGDAGVVCVSQAKPAPDVRSTWPDPTAALWIADLDGDGDPDWCSATADGPACGLAADRTLTTDGVPWGFAFGKLVEASAADGDVPDAATAVFTDVDGDGRDDLCTARAGVIACARSLSHGFGPRATMARLPEGMVPDALWAEPARAGAVARLCAADAATIACTDDTP